MQAKQVLNAPLFVTKLLFDLKNQKGGRNVLRVFRDVLGMSNDSAVSLGKKLKMAASPLLARKRVQPRTERVSLPESLSIDGWTKLSKKDISGTKELVKHCAKVFEKRKKDILANYKPPFALIFDVGTSIKNPEEIAPVIRFCAQHPLFDIVTSYLGEYPVLGSIAFGYTAPDSGKVGSQLFHCDSNEQRQLHMIIPISPVDMEAGPFTFLPEQKSAYVRKAIKHDSGRIPDEVMFSHVSENELVYCTGEPGDVYLVNPFSCLHYGARARSKHRLVLIINFTSLFQGVEPSDALYTASNRHALDDGQVETRLLLNL